MKKIILNILLVVNLLPFVVFAQSTATDPAASSGGAPAAVTPAPAATSTTPAPVQPAQPTPKVIPRSVTKIPTQTTPPPTIIANSTTVAPPATPTAPAERNYTALIAAALALGLGTAIFSVLRTKQKNKKNNPKCLNIEKLMEEKLNDLTDLRGQLTEITKNKATEKIKDLAEDTALEKLVAFIAKRLEEYEKLKQLYEECIPEINKSKKVLIFHGTEGYPEENWFPWLKEMLASHGVKAFVPHFPSPPVVPSKISEWSEVLKAHEKDIDKNTTLVGHSLGGIFALRVLEKLDKPIHAAFFVSTPIGIKPILNYDRDGSFSGFDFDWEKIKKSAKHFVVFQSDNDPYVGLENGKDLAKNLGVELTFVPNAGHFNTPAGYTKFKELWAKLKPTLEK